MYDFVYLSVRRSVRDSHLSRDYRDGTGIRVFYENPGFYTPAPTASSCCSCVAAARALTQAPMATTRFPPLLRSQFVGALLLLLLLPCGTAPAQMLRSSLLSTRRQHRSSLAPLRPSANGPPPPPFCPSSCGSQPSGGYRCACNSTIGCPPLL
jgi:hypothetical protein